MMTVDAFAREHAEFAFDFDRPMRDQPRIYAIAELQHLPAELAPVYEYRAGSRGRPNLNQTRAHSQCKGCGRVLRNDRFYTPDSQRARNLVYTYCIECTQALNAGQYDERAATVAGRRNLIWRYLAPRCVLCGFDTHPSAIDLHHFQDMDALIVELITQMAFAPTGQHGEALLREAGRCVALCSNCHRMVHAGVLSLPTGLAPTVYHLKDLFNLLLP
jgi:hypothetical protein